METGTSQSLQISKEFPVPVDQLYRAWVAEEALRQWWKPLGHELKEVNNELREGGRVEYRFRDGDKDPSLVISGQYETVRENERLVYSWSWQLPGEPVGKNAFRLTIAFAAREGGSRIEVQQENLETQENIQVHRQGWEQALDALHGYLSASGGVS